MENKFYEITQNNSGGSFDVDDKLCHRLFIEADNANIAASIAENLGCYWDGCYNDMDCPCCGDRWYKPGEGSVVDLDRINEQWGGYEVSQYLDGTAHDNENVIDNIKSMYPDAVWLTELKVETTKFGGRKVVGKIRMDNIEQYAQLMANLYGWTKPECRIYYKDGTVKNIYINKHN
jgi:hypothetical protein